MTNVVSDDLTSLSTVNTGWAESKEYSITFSTISRVVVGLFGAIAPFEDIIHSDENIESHYLGPISEEMYKTLSESIMNPHQLAFWNTDNTLKIRRIIVDFGSNTYLDNQRSALVGLGNTLTLIPKVVDQNGNLWSDITQLQVKNMSKLGFSASINNLDPENYKVPAINGQAITVKLGTTGRMTLRIKAVVPELSSVWLSVYPELYGYDESQLTNLAAWAATQN